MQVECFISKRNQVFLRDGVVIKRVISPARAAAEAELLCEYRNAGVRVPRVLEQRDNEIVMEFIKGETIPDFLARTQIDDTLLSDAATRLSSWFKCFYAAVNHRQGGEIRGDVNGRNFILSKDDVSSVDFECRAFGTAEQDLGRLLAFIKTYDIVGTRANNRFGLLFYNAVLKDMSLSGQEILRQYRLERLAIKKRRSSANESVRLR